MVISKLKLSLSVFWTLSIKVVGLVLGFVVSAVTARILLPESFGHYSVMVTVINVLAVMATLGAPVLVLRTVSRQVALQDDLAGMREFCGRLMKKMLIFTFVGTCAGIGYFIVAGIVRPYGFPLILISLLFGGMFSLAIMLSSFVRARKAVIEAQILQVMIKPVCYLLLLGLAILVVGRDVFGLRHALFIAVVSGLVAIAVSLMRFRFYYSGFPSIPMGRKEPVRDGLRWFAFINAAQVLNENVDMLLLGALGVAEDAAMYRVAFSVAMLISFPLTAANAAFGPWYSDYVAHNDRQALRRLVGWTGLAVSAVTLMSAALLVYLAEYLLGLAFGKAYLAAASILSVLVVGQVINGIAGPVALLLNFMHDERFVFSTLLVSLGISVALNTLLIPIYGALGAGISNAIAIGTWNVILVGRAIFKHDVNPTLAALVPHGR